MDQNPNCPAYHYADRVVGYGASPRFDVPTFPLPLRRASTVLPPVNSTSRLKMPADHRRELASGPNQPEKLVHTVTTSMSGWLL